MREHIRQSNLIEGVTEEKEVDQSLRAWDYIKDKPFLKKEVILRLHELVMQNLLPEEAGKYRKYNVTVGNYICPPHYTVSALVKQWIEWLEVPENALYLDPKLAHIEFEKIHPFADGNGRTGRLLMWWHERTLGLEPTLIEYDKRDEYYRWFR